MASSATATNATTLYKPVLTRPSEWPAWYTALKKVAGDRGLSEAVDIKNTNWLPLPKTVFFSYQDFLDHRYPQATPRTNEEKRGLVDNATTQQMQAWRTAATYADVAKPEDTTLKDIIKKLHTLVLISTGEEEAYSEAVRLDINEIKGTLALKDFFKAAGVYDANWKTIVMMEMIKAEMKGSTQQDLPYYAKTFRLICESQLGKATASKSAFPTFNGKPEGDRPTYICPCRPDAAFHKLEKCWALQEVITGKKGRHSTDKDFIQVGDTCLAIEGRGTWVIKKILNGPEGKNTVDLTLKDTAVIQNFHVNVV
ncbi:hypothetical protein B0T26DRAFT_869368 [Lasiosphaeria miniovina]|uniref:Uncharacterized protein n=1 Tax=Lasiosphaeria miniovina TaxID=1954250 RepID=A0AA40B5W3_9PEZI|nr:uncharacterized protein B0T26DRAFT_869368 [Lasiosphaeria miniovina]KAK0728260.1 hypothetical protein B0T26DRAFT_869368 [Lasiosphaeria miniovina]